MFENPVTGPSRTVPAGSSPSHGSASPGPAHFVVSISATHPKELVIAIASGLNHVVTPTITFTGPGVVSLGSPVVFSPSANRLVIPVTGVTAGAFTIQLAAAGFQTSSFTGTVVP